MLIELSSWKPNVELEHRLNAPSAPSDKRYLDGDQQRRVVEQLATNHDTIIVVALRGGSAKTLAACFGVSDEAIMRRLRPLGMLNPPGVRGRPPKSSRPGASQ